MPKEKLHGYNSTLARLTESYKPWQRLGEGFKSHIEDLFYELGLKRDTATTAMSELIDVQRTAQRLKKDRLLISWGNGRVTQPTDRQGTDVVTTLYTFPVKLGIARDELLRFARAFPKENETFRASERELEGIQQDLSQWLEKYIQSKADQFIVVADAEQVRLPARLVAKLADSSQTLKQFQATIKKLTVVKKSLQRAVKYPWFRFWL